MWNWNYFDDIICISCKPSIKRRKNCDKIFKKYKIPARYFIVDRHPNGSNHGCFLSHINIYKEAFEKQHKKILIFEDDIVPSTSLTSQNLNKSIRFMKKNKWDVFYLGAVPDLRGFKSTSKSSTENIYRLKSICTHAYVVGENVINNYKDLEYKKTPIDYLLRDDEKLNMFAYYPTFFYQETGYITVFSQNAINTYFRCLEWYAYNIGVPLVITFILFFVIIIISIRKLSQKQGYAR